MIEVLKETLILFSLGCLGWFVFARLSAPTPALFGTLVVVGGLRVLGVGVPYSPELLSPLVQIFLGFYVGSRVNRGTVRDLKSMVFPAAVIVAWALAIVFLLGFFLSRVTYLDVETAVLSSSMGGLPEMTVIALATSADVAVVIVMQTLRMVATFIVFPLIINAWMKKERKADQGPLRDEPVPLQQDRPGNRKSSRQFESFRGIGNNRLSIRERLDRFTAGLTLRLVLVNLVALLIAAAGGFLFLSLGVPAGGMVGAMFFVSLYSLLFNFQVKTPSAILFGFMLIGVGLMVSDNLTSETVRIVADGAILYPLLLSTVLIFISSFAVSYLIHKVVGWDFPTCFLAAAPGGFTIMTTLAIKYDKNPFRVSMLHLCRLLALKSVVPFVFMLYL